MKYHHLLIRNGTNSVPQPDSKVVINAHKISKCGYLTVSAGTFASDTLFERFSKNGGYHGLIRRVLPVDESGSTFLCKSSVPLKSAVRLLN